MVEAVRKIHVEPNGNKVPLEGILPEINARIFENGTEKKPERKLKTLKVSYGRLTRHNVEQFRVINYLTLPVVYSEDFYQRLINQHRYSKLAFVKDVLVGAISCKEDILDGGNAVYIMTINVLIPYRRYGIASQLLEEAIRDCAAEKKLKKIYLHVHSANLSAVEFYKKHGFDITETLKDYYTDISPPDCYIMSRALTEENWKHKPATDSEEQ